MADKATQLNAALREERAKNRQLKTEMEDLRSATAEAKELLREHSAMLKFGGGEYDEEELASRQLSAIQKELKETKEALVQAQQHFARGLTLSNSEMRARMRHGDAEYDERLELALEAMEEDPNLRPSIYGVRDPAEAAYQLGERLLQEKGSKTETNIDPSPEKTRLAASEEEDELDLDKFLEDDEDNPRITFEDEEEENVESKREKASLEAKLKAKEKVPPAMPKSGGDSKKSLSVERIANMSTAEYKALPKDLRQKLLDRTEKYLEE